MSAQGHINRETVKRGGRNAFGKKKVEIRIFELK